MGQITNSYDWNNTFPKEFAYLIEDREEDNAEQVIDWISQHENGDEVWRLINGAADEMTRRAIS